MKGCIALQGNYAKMGHALALRLKKDHGVGEFCAYVLSPRAKKFVDSQTDLAYSGLLVDFEVHERFKDEKLDLDYLRSVEEKFGPTLWSYVYPDRRITMSLESMDQRTMELNPLYSHEEIMKIVQVRIKSILKFLTEEKPDFIIFFALGTIGNMLLYHIAKKLGVKVLCTEIARLGDLMVLTEDFNTITGVKEVYEKIVREELKPKFIEEATRIVKNFSEKKVSYINYTSGQKKPHISLARRLQVYFNIFKTYWDERKYSLYDNPSSPWHFFKYKIIIKFRKLIGYQNFYQPANWQEDFVFYPLQCEPELSLLNIAPFYTDQLMVIRAIAQSLPLHYKLYIKEHPMMLNKRKRSYYKELLKIPNVVLVDTNLKSFDLTVQSKLVITITGTVGWEAALLGKPVITFGNIFYNNAPSVKKCHGLEDLPALVNAQLALPTDQLKGTINFVAAILENGVADMPYFQLEQATSEQLQTNQNVGNLANLAAQKIGLVAPTRPTPNP